MRSDQSAEHAEQSNFVAYSLYNGDYEICVGALANSLYRIGYRGRFWVGYQGKLPSWANSEIHIVHDDFEIRFIEVDDLRPISFHKPLFGIRLLEEFEPNSDGVFFFDADVIVVQEWRFFERWAAHSIACVLDYWSSRVPSGHPWRQTWSSIAREIAPKTRDINEYHQNALFGVPREHIRFLKIWESAIQYVQKSKKFGKLSFQTRSRYEWPHLRGDQDFFAIAVMATDVSICDVGTEAFGFKGFACIALHPFTRKPWRPGAWARIGSGQPPDLYEREFWSNVRTPIQVMSGAQQAWGLFRCRLAKAVGRFYRI